MATDDLFPSDGYRCGICSQKFHHPSLIYGCDDGHFFCQKCYREEYFSGKGPICPHRYCKAQIYRMDTHATVRENTSKKKKGKKMFPQPEDVSKELDKDSVKSLQVYLRGDTCSTHSLAHSSKKPVNCPYPACEKNIAVTAIDAHFKYEHKCVAFIHTYAETRNGLEFNPYDVKYNEKLCIVLINLLDETDEEPRTISRNSLKSLNDVGKANPVMLVMATRVPFYQLHENDDSGEDDDEDNPDDYEHYSYSPADKILLWVASNVLTNCKYTLAVSTPCKAIRLKYFGTVSQIGESCIKLCEDGKGLILNQPHSAGMTNNGKKPLTLDIVLHKEQSVEKQITMT